MKVSELMIGDVIKYDDTCVVVDLEFFEEARFNPIEEHIYPITLTDEILVANGFTKTRKEFGVEYSLRSFGIKEYYDVYVWVGNDEDNKYRWNCLMFTIKFYRGKLELCKKQYVHELQHALRLCGLNDTADNFEVKGDTNVSR